MQLINDLVKLIMTVSLSAFFVLSLNAQVASDNSEALAKIAKHRKKQEQEFKDKVKSPLDQKERRKFKGLHYYPPDLKYSVAAKFVKNETPVFFKMKTTTDRLPDYAKYGEVEFELDSQVYKLEVYQNLAMIKIAEYKDYLFIPFTDETNGKETYEVGRYIDFEIPKTDSVVVDFNLSYNPYCSYNNKYSCPIPPTVNHLPVAIEAGEKKYKVLH